MWWRLSTKRMTVGVEVDNELIIITAAPIVKGFIGQPILSLIKWMSVQEGFSIEQIKEPEGFKGSKELSFNT